MDYSFGVLFGLSAMVGWGFADFMQSVPIRKLGTFKTILISNVIAILMTIPLIFFKDALQIPINDMLILLVGGIFQAIAIANFYISMEIGEISIVTPISASYPLVTLSLMVLVLGKAMSPLFILAVLLMIFGITLTSTDLRKLKNLHTTKGVKQSLLTLVIWGAYFLILEIASGDYTLFGTNFPATNYLALFFYSGMFNSIFMVLFSFIKKGIPKREDFKSAKINFLLVFNQVIYLVVWLVLNYGFSQNFGDVITPVSSLYPAISIILAVIFYKEKLVTNQKIGIATLLLGLFLINL